MAPPFHNINQPQNTSSRLSIVFGGLSVWIGVTTVLFEVLGPEISSRGFLSLFLFLTPGLSSLLSSSLRYLFYFEFTDSTTPGIVSIRILTVLGICLGIIARYRTRKSQGSLAKLLGMIGITSAAFAWMISEIVVFLFRHWPG